jgi:hypothetical protein
MANAAMDHMISLVVFMVAMLLFMGLFSQSMDTAVRYESHRASAIKTSDLLETMLLSPGFPVNWGQSDDNPAVFGLHEDQTSQYKLNGFSLMRLTPSAQPPVRYDGSGAITYYNNFTATSGSCLLTPIDSGRVESLNYPAVAELLGINGVYGFQLTLTPTVVVSIEKTAENPLSFMVNVDGTGSPLANATITYSLITVNPQESGCPSFTIESGSPQNASRTGTLDISFPTINGQGKTYALLVYARLYGLKGMGCYVHGPEAFSDVVPMVESFKNQTITLAHSTALGEPAQHSVLSYNTFFAVLTEDYTLRQVFLDDPDVSGTVDSASDFPSLTLPAQEGVLFVAYKGTSAVECGVVLVPWGLSALAYPLTFGDAPVRQDWVTTDIRQVTVGGVSYQAQLALWRLNGGSSA